MPEPRAMTGEELALWRTLCDAATPGPWFVLPEDMQNIHAAPRVMDAKPDGFVARTWQSHPGKHANAAFIAAARDAVPMLLAHVAALEGQVAEARAQADVLREGALHYGDAFSEERRIRSSVEQRAEEAERQRDDYQATLNVVGAERDCARIERDALRAVAKRQEIAPNDHRRYISCRLCGGAWWPDERTRHRFDCSVSALDAVWPTWREGAGEEERNG